MAREAAPIRQFGANAIWGATRNYSKSPSKWCNNSRIWSMFSKSGVAGRFGRLGGGKKVFTDCHRDAKQSQKGKKKKTI